MLKSATSKHPHLSQAKHIGIYIWSMKRIMKNTSNVLKNIFLISYFERDYSKLQSQISLLALTSIGSLVNVFSWRPFRVNREGGMFSVMCSMLNKDSKIQFSNILSLKLIFQNLDFPSNYWSNCSLINLFFRVS